MALGPLRVGDGRPRVGERKWASQGWGTKVGLHRVGTKRGLSGLRRRRRVSRVLRGAPGFASRAARPSDPAGRLQSESIAVKGHASLGVSLECETPSPRPARFARLGSSSCGRRRQACELLARTLGAVLVCFKVVRRGLRAGQRCFVKATDPLFRPPKAHHYPRYGQVGHALGELCKPGEHFSSRVSFENPFLRATLTAPFFVPTLRSPLLFPNPEKPHFRPQPWGAHPDT